MAEVYLGLKATVTGTDEIAKLNKLLTTLRDNQLSTGQATDIARKRRAVATQELERKNMITTEMIGKDQAANFGLARQRVLFEQNSFSLQKQNIELERAVWIQQQYGMEMEESVAAAKAMIAAEEQLAEKERIAIERKKARIIQEKAMRRELMQASIGMFVMGITMTQTLDTMAKMAGQGTALEAVFKDMSQGVRLMLGPIQVLTAAMQFLNMENRKLMLTMGKFMILMAGVYIMYKAFTSKSKELRFVLGLIAGVLITLNALLLLNTARTWAKTVADIVNKSVMTFGTALPVLAAAVAGGLLIGFAAMATAPKGQTAPGYSRPVTDTGLVYAHRGETISRIGASAPQLTSGMTVIFQVPESSIVSTDMVDYMANKLEIFAASGMGG